MERHLACFNGLTLILMLVSFLAGALYARWVIRASGRNREIANRLRTNRDRST